ncbi:MAG: hypothetical protein RLY12_892 [Verrucomicrobiota bacterium]|jgi:hypothetical protein
MNIPIASLLAQASGGEEAALAAGLVAFFAAFFFVFLVIGLVVVVGMWKTFDKAGQPGWAAIVPFYNLVVMFRIGGQSGWFALSYLLNFIPIIGTLAFLGIIIWNHVNISKRFGQGVGFAIGLVLLAPIFWLILGFGSSKYLAEQPAQA